MRRLRVATAPVEILDALPLRQSLDVIALDQWGTALTAPAGLGRRELRIDYAAGVRLARSDQVVAAATRCRDRPRAARIALLAWDTRASAVDRPWIGRNSVCCTTFDAGSPIETW